MLTHVRHLMPICWNGVCRPWLTCWVSNAAGTSASAIGGSLSPGWQLPEQTSLDAAMPCDRNAGEGSCGKRQTGPQQGQRAQTSSCHPPGTAVVGGPETHPQGSDRGQQAPRARCPRGADIHTPLNPHCYIHSQVGRKFCSFSLCFTWDLLFNGTLPDLGQIPALFKESF